MKKLIVMLMLSAGFAVMVPPEDPAGAATPSTISTATGHPPEGRSGERRQWQSPFTTWKGVGHWAKIEIRYM